MSWATADASTDELLGHISLIGRGGELTDTAALGYWAHPTARGAGVTTAAALAVVNEALTPAAGGGGGGAVAAFAVSPCASLWATSGRSV